MNANALKIKRRAEHSNMTWSVAYRIRSHNVHELVEMDQRTIIFRILSEYAL